MDKRNSKKTEQTERKQEKKDRDDLRKEKPARKILNSDSSDAKVHTDRGDLKKNDKQTKKPADPYTNDTKLPPDRGDLKKPTRRIVEIVTKVIADRGDLKKTEKQTKKAADFDTNDPKLHPDREDTDRKPKPKLNVIIKAPDDKTKNAEHHNSRENIKRPFADVTKTVPEDKRKIRENCTLKAKITPAVTSNVNRKDEQLERTVKKPIETVKAKPDEANEPKQSVTIINFVKPEKKDPVQRKPIIRTISSKNNSKIYKAVTFVDQKRNKPSVLIKIPNENPKSLKSTETVAVCKVKSKMSVVTVKEKKRKKPDRRKRYKGKKTHATSPDLSVRARSPPTEVAKWAPSCINRHTKPYYEAWVSTTLAAISKKSRKDKLFLEKQNILQSFQRALAERPETPELVYENFNDERYTGRIKVKHR